MNRRAFLKWLSATATVILVAPSLIITPMVEPVPMAAYEYWMAIVREPYPYDERVHDPYWSTYR